MKTLIFIYFLSSISLAEVLVGKAINLDGEFVYTEEHSIDRDSEGRAKRIETVYFDSEGKTIAKMTSDFAEKLAAPDSKFEDFRFNRVFEGKIAKEGDKDIYKISEFDSGKLIKATDLSYKTDLVSGSGFDNYIKENLVRKRVTQSSVHFLVMPRHDYYRFEVIDKGLSADSDREYVIKPSLVLSLFVKEIKIFYDEKSGILKKYVGLSNLPSAKDKPQSVVIEYKIKSPTKPEGT